MTPKRQIEILAATIPQLYEASNGYYDINFSFDRATIHRWSYNQLTPKLKEYRDNCQGLLAGFKTSRKLHPTAHEENKLSEFFAMEWLKIYTDVPTDVWEGLFDYFYQLNRRTNENSFIHKTIRLKHSSNPAAPGTFSLRNTKLNKVLDLLGSGSTTNLIVDKNLNILGAESINVSAITFPEDYVFYPDFMTTQIEANGEADIIITSTIKGDLLICFNKKLIASKRRDKWTIYDPETFKNTIRDVLGGDYRLSCNLYGILLDLSYRRHGGLLVIDNEDNFTNYVRPGGTEFARLIPDTRYDSRGIKSEHKKQLIEFASVDGAVLVNKANGKIKSFGRIIKTHADCTQGYGARSTAAESAVRYGATAFKVSSDGDISLIFKSVKTGDEIVRIDYL